MQSQRKAAKPKTVPFGLANFDSLPDSAYVDINVVLGLYACCKQTVWRHVKEGNMPAPVKLNGSHHRRWLVGTLRQARAAQAEASR